MGSKVLLYHRINVLVWIVKGRPSFFYYDLHIYIIIIINNNGYKHAIWWWSSMTYIDRTRVVLSIHQILSIATKSVFYEFQSEE